MAALTVDIREKWFPAVGDAPEKLVMQGVRFSAAAGEKVVIIGPSGCGKTTLLNIIAGLDRDFEGSVRLPAEARIGYVFQEPRLLPWRTVEENLAFVLPENAPDLEARIAQVLAEVGLEATAKVYASRLSLGMARRVAIARGFVVRPDLLLLDEPFVSLDEATAQRLRLLLLDLLATHHTMALFITHNLREAIMLADRLLFLSASPAMLLEDITVDLDERARRDPLAIEAFRARLPTLEAVLASPPPELALEGQA